MTATEASKASATARTLSEALPYIQRYDQQTLVIKYGGHAMESPEHGARFARDVTLLRQLGINPVVVHGGGPQIGAMLERLGVTTAFEDGLRVTDAATMEVVEMVLAGAINTSIVGAVNAAGGRAVGLSGVDGNMIRARKAKKKARDPDSHLERIVDLGFVGEPAQVDGAILQAQSRAGFIPVVAPVGVGAGGERYNINADTAAGAIAAALGATRLLLMTDVAGVQARDGELVRRLDARGVDRLIRDGVVTGGMIPKLTTAVAAVERGVGAAVILDGTAPHALLVELFTEHGSGTLIE